MICDSVETLAFALFLNGAFTFAIFCIFLYAIYFFREYDHLRSFYRRNNKYGSVHAIRIHCVRLLSFFRRECAWWLTLHEINSIRAFTKVK